MPATMVFAALSDITLLRLGVGGAVVCFGMGWMLAKVGWKAFQRQRIALTSTKDLTGTPARIAACLFLAMAAIVTINGLGITAVVIYAALKKFVL